MLGFVRLLNIFTRFKVRIGVDNFVLRIPAHFILPTVSGKFFPAIKSCRTEPAQTQRATLLPIAHKNQPLTLCIFHALLCLVDSSVLQKFKSPHALSNTHKPHVTFDRLF